MRMMRIGCQGVIIIQYRRREAHGAVIPKHLRFRQMVKRRSGHLLIRSSQENGQAMLPLQKLNGRLNKHFSEAGTGASLNMIIDAPQE